MQSFRSQEISILPEISMSATTITLQQRIIHDMPARQSFGHQHSSQREVRTPWHTSKASRWRLAVTRREGLVGSLLPCCCGCKNGIKDGWYDKFFASAMANGMQAYEEAVAPFKKDLLRNVRFRGGGSQSVLEIGIGAAPNLQYLTTLSAEKADGLSITGVDPNPYMFNYAKESGSRAGLDKDQLFLNLGTAEAIPAPDASFDTVVCTLVLCSVPNVPAAIREMRRVLKRDGKLFFLEHISASPEKTVLRAAQRVLSPVQQLLADGCHLDRDPLKEFATAGFASLDSKRFDVPGMGVIAPHVSGVAIA